MASDATKSHIFQQLFSIKIPHKIIILYFGVPAKAIFGPKRWIFQIFFSYHFYSKFARTRYLPTLVLPSGASIHTACAHFRTPSMCYPAKRRPSVTSLANMFWDVTVVLFYIGKYTIHFLPPDFVVPLDNMR